MSEKYYFMGYNYPTQAVRTLLCKVCNLEPDSLSSESDISSKIDFLVHTNTSLYAAFAKEMYRLRFSNNKTP